MGSRGPAPQPPKQCEYCPAMFVGKRRARFCSKSCAAKAAGEARAARIRAELAETERRCAYAGCGEVLVQREGERVTGFRERSYCGPECVGKARRTEPRVELCRACGERLVRREDEAWSDFVRRSSCGTSCRSALGHLSRAETRPVRAPRRKPAPARVLSVFPEGPRTEVWRPAAWGGSVPIRERAS